MEEKQTAKKAWSGVALELMGRSAPCLATLLSAAVWGLYGGPLGVMTGASVGLLLGAIQIGKNRIGKRAIDPNKVLAFVGGVSLISGLVLVKYVDPAITGAERAAMDGLAVTELLRNEDMASSTMYSDKPNWMTSWGKPITGHADRMSASGPAESGLTVIRVDKTILKFVDGHPLRPLIMSKCDVERYACKGSDLL